jgi:hypothetical protein
MFKFLIMMAMLLNVHSVWAADAQPFVVVELFTSEGCSSCPPADALLRQLIQEAKEQNRKVFALSFHVDYWNRLGWTDPFSSEQFTERQSQYAGVFGSTSVYTPQMVLNGKEGFTGSDENRARKRIAEYLKASPTNAINLKAKRIGTQSIEVAYRCAQVTPGAVLNIALVERRLEVSVPRGENAGRILKHDNVVRVFKTIALTSQEGVIDLGTASMEDASRYSVVAYVQDAVKLNITAADEVGLDS